MALAKFPCTSLCGPGAEFPVPLCVDLMPAAVPQDKEAAAPYLKVISPSLQVVYLGNCAHYQPQQWCKLMVVCFVPFVLPSVDLPK
jgi:hypothetical protein